LSVPGTGGINQDAPDGLRGDGQEVGSAFPDGLVLVDQAQIGLVNERGGLEGEVLPLGAEVAFGDGSEFVVEDGQEYVDRPLVTGSDAVEEVGDVLLLGHATSTLA